MLKPSNFTVWPWSSVSQNSEAEKAALNIMKILKRTGDTWRKLTWDEYVAELKKDSNASDGKEYFDRVVDYCSSPEKAKGFCPDWAKVI